MPMSPEAQVELLTDGAVDVERREELLERIRAGRPLRVKAGFDPTRPDLHLGHTVLMHKMRQFQQLGHEIVFIVGDFTARIGDPTGRSKTRQVVTEEEIEEGARTYQEQAFKILDPDRTRVVRNSEWLGSMSFADVIRLAGKYTLARMMERDDFAKRWSEHAAISLHELLYPLAQGYDSVHLRCDVELGGTDQLFNLLVGRRLMREHGLPPQIVMTTPILEGLNARVEEDGTIVGDKMSKSLDNYVGITEPPTVQLGKLMSISDGLMWRYYQLLSETPPAEVAALRASCERGETNPRDAKLRLAKEIVGRYHGQAAADAAEREWMAQFSRREVPQDMPEVELTIEGDRIWLPKALADAGVVKSSSEGKRRVQAGAVQVDGQKVTDPQAQLTPGEYVIKAGKRAWVKLRVR